MVRLNWVTRQNGMSLVEVILAVALFGLFATALVGLLMTSYGSDFQAKEKDKAALYAQQGMDAVLSIRRQAWNLLVNGDYGLTSTNGHWEFFGSSETLDDKYTRTITIADGCRNGGGDIVDCNDAGATVDLYTKKVTVTVIHTSINGVNNQIQAVGYLTTWQTQDWVQTDWLGGDGQSIWSNQTRYDSDDGNIDVSTAGQVALAPIAGGGCGVQRWSFDAGGDYVYTPSKIEVTGGQAQLVGTAGPGPSGQTTNPGFTSNANGWTYADWDQNSGEVNVAGSRVTSGGNPGAYIRINVPSGNSDEVGGYYRQPFTTSVSGPSGSVSFDWRVTAYDSTPPPINFRLYVFVDTTTAAPTIGTEVWSSGLLSGTSGWASVSGVDIASKIPTAGTYYLKIAVWAETPGSNSGPFTVGYDNVLLNWSSSTTSYPTDRPTINPTGSYVAPVIDSWSSFAETATKNGGEIYYQLSDDNGSSWRYWNGSTWASAGASNYNPASIINTNISSFSTTTGQIMFKAFLESNGTQLVQLDEVRISCAQFYDWPFETAGDYTYTPSAIEISGGIAQLVGSVGGASGSITNSSFDSGTVGWTYGDWGQGGGEVNVTGNYMATGGNPGGWIDINFPAGNNDELGGYWQQAFTTTVDDPMVLVDFQAQVLQFEAGSSFVGYVFIDSTPGPPTIGTQVWSSTVTGLTGINSYTDIDGSSHVGAAGTYYLKLALWLETPGGSSYGPYQVGLDNVYLDWTQNISYPTDRPTINPTGSYVAPVIDSWSSFAETATKNGGEIYYQLSDDNGSSWRYWNGSTWASAGASNYNPASIINTNISSFSTTTGQIMFKAFLESNGTQLVQLDNVKVGWGEVIGGSGGYKTAGWLQSSALNMGSPASVHIIEWDQVVPSCSPACTVKLQVRTAPDVGGSPGSWTNWYGSSGAGSYFTNNIGEAISTDLNFNQWLQYRAELAGDGLDTPLLEAVRINYLP